MPIKVSLRITALSLVCAMSLIASGCGSKLTAVPTAAASATLSPTSPVEPSVAPPATSSTNPLPPLTLRPGEHYFSVDRIPSFLFSRNVAGYQQVQYAIFLDWAKNGGSRIARVQLDSLGMGYTKDEIDSNWLGQWDQIFGKAEQDGIYILPVFSGWFDWNAGTGYSTWKSNPLNEANAGAVKQPAELFQNDSATQHLWMQWMKLLVQHWQGWKESATGRRSGSATRITRQPSRCWMCRSSREHLPTSFQRWAGRFQT